MAVKNNIAWYIAAIGGLLAIAGQWHNFGWTTPHQHSEDVNDFRKEWRCDELAEEIDVLLLIPAPSATDMEELNRKRDRYDEDNCDDFG